MNDLVQELIAGARRLDIEAKIGDAMRHGTAFHLKFKDSVAPTVRLTANFVNGYIDYLGFDQIALERRPALQLKEGRTRHIFMPRSAPTDFPRLDDKPSKYDQQYYTDWIKAFLETVEANAGFVDGQAIDIEANSQLGGYLARLAPVAA